MRDIVSFEDVFFPLTISEVTKHANVDVKGLQS